MLRWFTLQAPENACTQSPSDAAQSLTGCLGKKSAGICSINVGCYRREQSELQMHGCSSPRHLAQKVTFSQEDLAFLGFTRPPVCTSGQFQQSVTFTKLRSSILVSGAGQYKSQNPEGHWSCDEHALPSSAPPLHVEV
mmetsp:Transcript_18611/g.28977  ORF Transcript_18611/g.28977 Transcript_18611/m.28977 type:complete len:138 (+) Transcript_18611:116-529(+)